MSTTSRPHRTGNRPNLALRLERTVHVAGVLAAVAAPTVTVRRADLVAAAAARVETDRREEIRDAVCGGMLAYTTACVAEQLATTLRSHPLPVGLELEDLARPDGVTVATERAGCGLRSARASAYAQLAELVQVQAHLRSDGAGLLRRAWTSVADDRADLTAAGALDARIAVHTSAGVDAERFVWAAIVHESRKHIGLVWHEANKLTRNRPESPDDMLGYGWQGLRAALRSYDPAVAALATYACPRINGAIRSGLRSELPYSKRSSDLINAAARAEEALVQELTRAPSLGELASKLGESLEVLRKLPALQPTASIEELTSGLDGETHHAGWLADSTDVEEATFERLAREEIAAALGRLPAEEAAAVQLVVLDGLRPAEAAGMLGVDTRKLRTWKNRGLTRLQEDLTHLLT